MDSKYNLIENGRDTPAINGFGIKRKFSNGTAAHHNNTPNKKQCDGKESHFLGNSTNGNNNGDSPRPPAMSIADQRRNLPVFHVRRG